MKSKFILYFLALTLMATASFGQTDQQKPEKIKKNPATAKAAAQADARLIDMKIIVDRHSLDSTLPKRKDPGYKSGRKRKPSRHSI